MTAGLFHYRMGWGGTLILMLVRLLVGNYNLLTVEIDRILDPVDGLLTF
jgi:hypothetical protein